MKKGDGELDKIIDKLLSVRGCKPGKQINLTEGEVKYICNSVTEVLMAQPVLLELEAPMRVCGIRKNLTIWSKVI
jgi:serine/threonine-protein phosphatase PP1 catalytic subunit